MRIQTCKVWDSHTGQLFHTYRGHSTEIVCLSFNPDSSIIATGSMDNTAKLWDTETGQELHTLTGHSAEVRNNTQDVVFVRLKAQAKLARSLVAYDILARVFGT
jgi:WD40 repeat protein